MIIITFMIQAAMVGVVPLHDIMIQAAMVGVVPPHDIMIQAAMVGVVPPHDYNHIHDTSSHGWCCSPT